MCSEGKVYYLDIQGVPARNYPLSQSVVCVCLFQVIVKVKVKQGNFGHSASVFRPRFI